jgi:ribosomal-protein-alanine N-acetyltransferase
VSADGRAQVLETERLRLCRSDVADLESVRVFFTDHVAHLRRYLPEAEPFVSDPGFANKLAEHANAELCAGREERWFFSLRERPDVLVGYVFLTRFRYDGHRSCELSYGLGSTHEGQGLMREATLAMLQHARQTLGFTRVDARYDVDNDRSARLLERLGFERIGVARAHAWLDGAWRDHVLVTRVERSGAPADSRFAR